MNKTENLLIWFCIILLGATGVRYGLKEDSQQELIESHQEVIDSMAYVILQQDLELNALDQFLWYHLTEAEPIYFGTDTIYQ